MSFCSQSGFITHRFWNLFLFLIRKTGLLVPRAPAFVAAPLNVTELAVPSTNDFLYTSNGSTKSVSQFSITNGVLTPLAPANVAAGVTSVIDVKISPDNKHIYVVDSLGLAPSVYQFSRDLLTGLLTALAPASVGVAPQTTAYTVAISPDGAFAYVVGDTSIAQFSRDSNTGLLTPLAPFIFASTIIGGTDIVISPNGVNVYVSESGGVANTIFQFSRNVVTGQLSAMVPAAVSDGAAFASKLSLAMSKDGKNVYASDGSIKSLDIFSRDLFTGALTFLSSIPQGGNCRDVVTSFDNNYVYTTDYLGAVYQYSRNPVTGLLTLLNPNSVAAVGAANLITTYDDSSVFVSRPLAVPSIYQFKVT